MKIRNIRDLGLLLRDRRVRLGLSQADVASRIGASRHWVMALEAGKSTVEAGLVLNALSSVGLLLDLRPASPHHDPVEPVQGAAGALQQVDLADVLAGTRARSVDE